MDKTEYEIQHQKDLEYIKNFRLIDDDFMKKVFEDKECVQLTLRIIMDKPDLIVTEVHTEYEVTNLYGRSVRLDVHATDNAGKEYDIEIQRRDRGASSLRARYNSSIMDTNALEAGEDFTDLPETYVIFITENDVLKRNLPIYHIERVIRETGELFDDKAHIIYVNNEIQDDTPLGLLMRDFVCKNADDMHYDVLAERVRNYKEDEGGLTSMCRAMEEMRAEAEARGKAEGIAEGKAEGKAEGIEKMIELLRERGLQRKLCKQYLTTFDKV
ncbi:MAG: PD-(D/E)XK nuclease family transposase, partial [Oscillospiraceae bacterium]|nr:PD-(D/E)XK nuclease family transposase [Oscillospiraceae bacterium]